MLVLGDIGQMREVAERADNADRLLGRQAADGILQLLPGGGLGIATEAKGGLPDLFDELEGALAFLRAHRLAEDAPEVPNVVAQRRIPVPVFAIVCGNHRATLRSIPTDHCCASATWVRFAKMHYRLALTSHVWPATRARVLLSALAPMPLGAFSSSQCQTAQSRSFPRRNGARV
jgi:hypothetical protein